jgi:predicted nucleic acid-binding protein
MRGRSAGETVMLDACSLINLYASGQIHRVLGELPMDFGVAEWVAHEALFVLPRAGGNEPGPPEPIDLPGLVERGLIAVHSIETTEEATTYVAFAAELDDGEAMTCAIAFHRTCTVVTDDRKALRVLGRLAPQVRVVSTLDIVRLWATRSGADSTELRRMLADVRDRARYVPRHDDPSRP